MSQSPNDAPMFSGNAPFANVPDELTDTVTVIEIKPTDEELANRFNFHPPADAARASAHQMISSECHMLAIEIRDICPAGRNLSLALTHLEDVRMRANAALACDSEGSET